MANSTYNTALLTVVQSTACHPDWDLETHLCYLESETGLDLDEPVTTARWPEGPHTHPLREYVKNWVKWPVRAAEVANRICTKGA